MISPWVVGSLALGYIAFLFLVARWAEKRANTGKNPVDNPWVYSLTIAIYCTSWTFYGSVGSAATNGYLFLAIYLGATACVFLWWNVLRKMVRIKNRHRITSIADFISARYDRSQKVAAIATLIIVVGMTPYISLQLKSLFITFKIIAGGQTQVNENFLAIILVVLLSLFTIVFGARKLDPTERHSGMMAAIAMECVIKLLAFLAVGIFVTFGIFDGFGDIFGRLSETPLKELASHQFQQPIYTLWATYFLLSMSAILFLPRQFHVSVIENTNENHILTAMWVFPLYLVLINLFVLPIAIGGLALGLSPDLADTFVLRLPLEQGNKALSLLVFLGGFSAATGMVIVCTMTIATMVTNHWLVPLSDLGKPLHFIRHNLLRCRWASILAILGLGYFFERTVGESYTLLNIGILSFAALLQFAPSALGGLYWKSGNHAGALWGLWAGFGVWAYTLLFPSFVHSGWFPVELLNSGPLGIEILKPESLLGLTALDPLTHGVFWSLSINITMYIGASLLIAQTAEERRIAEEYVGILLAEGGVYIPSVSALSIDVGDKIARVEKLYLQYFPKQTAKEMLAEYIKLSKLDQKEEPSIFDVVQFYEFAETHLAGAIGAASAHRAFEQAELLTDSEKDFLSRAYGEILADLKLSPQALRSKVDYYREREFLLQRISDELEAQINERDKEIAERVRAESTLRASEQRQRLLLESSPDPIVSYDTKGLVTYANPAFVNLFGWEREELLGKTLDYFVPESETEKTGEAIRILADGKTIHNMETLRKTRKGEILEVQISAAPFYDAEKKWSGSIVYIRDVTARKHAEVMLRLMAAAIEHSAEAVLITDAQGFIIYGNKASKEMKGDEASELGNLIALLFKNIETAQGKALANAFENQLIWKGSVELKKPDLSIRLVECTVSPIYNGSGFTDHFVAILRDVTNERRMEEHLQHRQKLDAIGTLAGGIAHDFNNILQPMIGFTEVARQRLTDDKETAEILDRVLSSAERARGLIKQILTFARPEETRGEPVDLAKLLEEVHKFLRASLPSTLEIVLKLNAKSSTVLGDPTRLHQVVINICTNAAHAMEGKNGVMTIELNDFRMDESLLNKYPELKVGEYLQLCISDTGTGMTKEVMARIFEPFFTTKQKGKGTGLGLAVVHGIVRNMGGAISVYSEPGLGSTFRVFLPKTGQVAAGVDEKPKEVQWGHERILFVDDEGEIRELTKVILEKIGYSVQLAANGVEALSAFKANPEGFDILITDFTMPGMTGKTLAHEIKLLKPDLPIILCTGYNAQVAGGSFGVEIEEVLSKPFTTRELGEKIRKVLDSRTKKDERQA